jgi:hypothetical protein
VHVVRERPEARIASENAHNLHELGAIIVAEAVKERKRGEPPDSREPVASIERLFHHRRDAHAGVPLHQARGYERLANVQAS